MKLWQLVQTATGLSRRRAQALVRSGEVESKAGPIIDPFAEIPRDGIVYLRGQPLCPLPRRYQVYQYYKPRGVLCSHDDPHTGNTVGRVLRAAGFIGYTWAGRLDRDAEGLMLISNDGDLIARLTHPRYGVEKIYHVWIDPLPTAARMAAVFARMRAGIDDAGDRLGIRAGKFDGRRAMVALGQGHNHEVKRLFARFGFTVVRLQRVAIGPVRLPVSARPGEITRLKPDATRLLYSTVGLNPPPDL